MIASVGLVFSAKPFQAAASTPRGNRRRMQVSCTAMPEQQGRRGLLAGLAVLPLLAATSPAEAKMIEKIMPAKSISAFQRRDIYAEFQGRAVAEIKKVVTGADAPTAMRLLFHDAATYDAISKTGGVNGSVVLSDELNRPENKDMKNLVDRLATARAAVTASSNPLQRPLSWADTIVLACKVTQQINWRAEIIDKNPINGEYLANSFSNPITVKLGRADADSADAAVPFPAPGASAADVKAFCSKLGVKNAADLSGPLAKKAPFWERVMFVLWTAAQPDPAAAEAALVAGEPEAFGVWKEKYDKSRKNTMRLDYEVDFNEYLNKLADLGAKIDPSYYLYDLVIKVPQY